MLDRRAIPYVHWQAKIGRRAPAWGEIVDGVDDIEQSILTIALTEKGSVPTQPEKCVSLQPYVDRRAAWAIPYITRGMASVASGYRRVITGSGGLPVEQWVVRETVEA